MKICIGHFKCLQGFVVSVLEKVVDLVLCLSALLVSPDQVRWVELWEDSFQNMFSNTRLLIHLLIHFIKEISGLTYCSHTKQTLDPSII